MLPVSCCIIICGNNDIAIAKMNKTAVTHTYVHTRTHISLYPGLLLKKYKRVIGLLTLR